MRSLRQFFLFFILLIPFSLCGKNPEKKTIYHFKGSNDYPPFEFINQDGKPDGFNVDLFKAMMEELGYEYDLQLESWNDMMDELQNKSIDGIIGTISYPDRYSFALFGIPTCLINHTIVSRKQDNYTSLADLKGKEIITQRGSWSHNYLSNNNISDHLVFIDNLEESLDLISKGKHDAALTNDLTSLYFIKLHHLNNLVTHPSNLDQQFCSFAVNTDRRVLLNQMNSALQQLRVNGKYGEIYNKWFGVMENHDTRNMLLWILIPYTLVVIVLLLSLYFLHKKVKSKAQQYEHAKKEMELAIDIGQISI